MFKAAPTNPYDELVIKATHEDLLSEDWDTNLTICDKVQAEGEVGAKNVITSLLKRLVHRNPNVQIFSLELANSLYQNCNKLLHLELTSRAWTGAMERLITDRTTVPQVKNKAVGYVNTWWQGLKGGEAEGVMGDLIETLKTKNVPLEVPTKRVSEDEATKRAREEEAELQRVLELSKQDQGGRNSRPAQTAGPSGSGNGSGSGSTGPSASHTNGYGEVSSAIPYHHAPPGPAGNAAPQPSPFPAREPTPPPMPTRATASRVRAIYPFVTHEKGELSFDKGDVIKVIDRMYDEWYTGAVGGRIGIFPVSYVEPLPDPTTQELQREAQEEAKIFAAQGMIVNLQRMLDGFDPSRGDRLDDPELENMYQKVVELQPQIVSLMKKYADQRAELEHIHMGFVKASRQYAVMTQPQQAANGYAQPGQDPYAAQGVPQQHRQTSYGSQQALGQGQGIANDDPVARQQAEHAAAWAAYYAQLAQHQQAMAAADLNASGQQPGQGQIHPQRQQAPQQQHHQSQHQQQQHHLQQQQDAQMAGQSEAEREKIAAAWQAYYASQAQAQAQAQAHGQLPAQGQAQIQPAMQSHPGMRQGSGSYGHGVDAQGQPMGQALGATSTSHLPLARSPEPAAQPLLSQEPAQQRYDPRLANEDSMPNPYGPAGAGPSAPSFPGQPQQQNASSSYLPLERQTSGPPPIAPKPAIQVSQEDSAPVPYASAPGQNEPYGISPGLGGRESVHPYGSPSPMHGGSPAVHPSTSPYMHSAAHQAHTSQGSVVQQQQQQQPWSGAPSAPGPMHGLERAVSNLSVSNPPPPHEARFV